MRDERCCANTTFSTFAWLNLEKGFTETFYSTERGIQIECHRTACFSKHETRNGWLTVFVSEWHPPRMIITLVIPNLMRMIRIPGLVQPTLCHTVICMLSCAILLWSLGIWQQHGNVSAARQIPDKLARYFLVSWPTVQSLLALCVLTTVYIYTVLQHVAAASGTFSPASYTTTLISSPYLTS